MIIQGPPLFKRTTSPFWNGSMCLSPEVYGTYPTLYRIHAAVLLGRDGECCALRGELAVYLLCTVLSMIRASAKQPADAHAYRPLTARVPKDWGQHTAAGGWTRGPMYGHPLRMLCLDLRTCCRILRTPVPARRWQGLTEKPRRGGLWESARVFPKARGEVGKGLWGYRVRT